MKTQVFLSWCVVVLMAAHTVLADVSSAECYQTTDGTTYTSKLIGSRQEACYADARGHSSEAATACACAAAAEAMGMNSFKFDATCLLYRGTAGEETGGTVRVYSVTSMPFLPHYHEFDLTINEGIQAEDLRLLGITSTLDDPCNIVTNVAVKNYMGNAVIKSTVLSANNLHEYNLRTTDICAVDTVEFQALQSNMVPVGPSVVWTNPKQSSSFGDPPTMDAVFQTYTGPSGDIRCIAQINSRKSQIEAAFSCYPIGGYLYGDAFEGSFSKDITIDGDYWVFLVKDGDTYKWKNNVDEPYSAETWFAAPATDQACVYIGRNDTSSPLTFVAANCAVEKHLTLCSSHQASAKIIK